MSNENILTYWQYDENSDAFKRLLDRLNVKKCFCLTEEKNKQSKDSRLEYIYFFERFDFYSKSKIEFELDTTILTAMKPFELRCLQVINRWRKSFLPKDTFKSVEEIFYVLLRYWNNFIRHNNISLMILTIMPHTPHEYVPYAICKALNIPVILQGTMAFLPGEKTNYILRPSVECYDEKLQERFIQNLEDVKGRRFKTIELPDYLKRYIEHYELNSGQKNKSSNNVVLYNEKNSLCDIINKYKRLAAKYLYRRDYLLLIKKAFYLLKIRLESRKLLKRFSKFEVDPVLSKRYLFFALHLQPEATTLPLGGDYANQLLAISLISSCLPDDVLLYVKEHPAYWSNKNRIESISESRSKSFYESIVSLPNVRLVNHGVSSSVLLKDCLGVVTVTGTVGFESIFQGKPVMIFGSTYYENYPGVYRIKTREECLEALNKICSKSASIYNRLTMSALLAALDKYVIPMGMNEKSFLDNGIAGVEAKDCEKLVDKIVDFYYEYYA